MAIFFLTDSEDADIALSIVGFVLAAVPVFTNVISPVKSVVQIHFPTRNMTLANFNDKFDLRRGDLVYVDGKLEGLRGRVVDVAYNFKIKLSKYQRVIAVVDTEVHGIFHLAGSYFVTFDRDALPQAKVRIWYKAPDADDSIIMKQLVEQIIVGDDGIEVHFKCGIVASHEYL